jgi:hypothetical protein
VTCAAPIAFDTLVALWCGELDPARADELDEHLFGCDDCARAAERLGELIGGLREVIPPVISHAHRDRLVAAGKRLLLTPVSAGVDARAVFAPDVDLLVHVLRADLTGAERVDVELVDEHGAVRLQLVGVPFDPRAGEVLIACQRHYEHHPYAPTFHVHAVVGGERREVGRYWIDHIWR